MMRVKVKVIAEGRKGRSDSAEERGIEFGKQQWQSLLPAHDRERDPVAVFQTCDQRDNDLRQRSGFRRTVFQ